MKYASRLFAVIGVLSVLLLFAAPSRAQFPAMNPMGMMQDMQYGPVMLLMRSEVQKELKLDKKQNEEIKKLQKEQMDLMKNQRGMGRGTDTTQMMESFNKLQAQQAEYNNKAKAVLTDDQKKRFGEIRMQAIGISSVFDPETQTALAVTPDQKASLANLNTEYTSAKLSLMQDMQTMRSPGAFKSKQEAQDKEFQEKVAKILTADQNTQLKKMEGEPFKDLKKIKGMM